MKKGLILLMAVLYLGVASGATLHYQYCMGRLVKVTFWHHHNAKCQVCGMNKKDKATGNCCTDKHEQIKSEKSSALNAVSAGPDVPPALPALPIPYWHEAIQLPVAAVLPSANSPPPLPAVPAFILNCTYRI